uniref:C2H2-type domain-containing protein n=1 Tax=Steinernema glaseri TaxID=37863 RepID=A0A1I7ZMB0_9BILA
MSPQSVSVVIEKTPLQMWLEKRAVPEYFHCFDCGREFRHECDYDEHLYVHQFLDICFQIQEVEDMRLELEAIRMRATKRKEEKKGLNGNVSDSDKSSDDSSTDSDE